MMNRIQGVAGAALLTASLAVAGCGGEGGIEQNGEVTGWSYSIDATNVSDEWVSYTDQTSVPRR